MPNNLGCGQVVKCVSLSFGPSWPWLGVSGLGDGSCRTVAKLCALLGRSGRDVVVWKAGLWAGGKAVGLVGEAVGWVGGLQTGCPGRC